MQVGASFSVFTYAGFQDELDELFPVCLCCDEVSCIGSRLAVSLVGSLAQSPFSLCFGEERGPTGSPQAASPGFSSVRPICPSFLILPLC